MTVCKHRHHLGSSLSCLRFGSSDLLHHVPRSRPTLMVFKNWIKLRTFRHRCTGLICSASSSHKMCQCSPQKSCYSWCRIWNLLTTASVTASLDYVSALILILLLQLDGVDRRRRVHIRRLVPHLERSLRTENTPREQICGLLPEFILDREAGTRRAKGILHV